MTDGTETAQAELHRRAVPRRDNGGASAPPPADNELQRKIDHYRNQLAQDTADVQDTAPRTAADFCAEAARLVGGPRAATHGDKLANFQNIADLWNGYWRVKCRTHDERVVTPFTALDVGNMMELMKVARRFSGTFNADDYTDAAGYAGCAGEIAAREAAKESSRA